jgi:hypothetical protein
MSLHVLGAGSFEGHWGQGALKATAFHLMEVWPDGWGLAVAKSKLVVRRRCPRSPVIACPRHAPGERGGGGAFLGWGPAAPSRLAEGPTHDHHYLVGPSKAKCAVCGESTSERSFRRGSLERSVSALAITPLLFAGAPAVESPAGAGSAGISDVAWLEIHKQAALQNTSSNAI